MSANAKANAYVAFTYHSAHMVGVPATDHRIGTDLFYLAVAASADGQPLMLQTATRGGGGDGGVAVTLHDLLPGRTYTLRWRAHPATTGRNIGWDWIQ